MMRPEDLTITHVAEIFGGPPPTWEGNCYAVANAAQKALGSGTLVYGHYLGSIAKKGFWGRRKGLPFVQHGWVILDDGRILDPTRWSFLATKPAIWIGPDLEYDRGGQQWRASRMSPPPADDASPNRIVLEICAEGAAHINAMLLRPPHGEINFFQACWLASGPVTAFGPYAEQFFELLVEKGWDAAIPIDSLRMVMKEDG